MSFEDRCAIHGEHQLTRATGSIDGDVILNVNTCVRPLDCDLAMALFVHRNEPDAVMHPKIQVTRRLRRPSVGPCSRG